MTAIFIIAVILSALTQVICLAIEIRRHRQTTSCREGHQPEAVGTRHLAEVLPAATSVLLRCRRCGDFRTVVHVGLWELADFQKRTDREEIAFLEQLYRGRQP